MTELILGYDKASEEGKAVQVERTCAITLPASQFQTGPQTLFPDGDVRQ